MSENEDRYHDTVLDLEAKLKKNVDLILKLGNSLQGMFMLGPKPLSVYDQQLKHGLGYPNPYTLKQAISQCPKLYLASSLGNSEISLNVRDTEDTLDDASKSKQKVYEKMNDPIAVANKQNCWTIDYAQINALYKDFVPQKELSAEQKYFPSSFIPSDKNSNATPSIPASMPTRTFYSSPEEIQLNDFCQDQLKPIVNELQFYFEFFKTLFQRDIKEMKDVFESTESELCELEKQNDFLKDQLLEVSLKHEVELSVLLNHECVDNSLHAEIEQLKKKSIEIQEGLQARIKILEKDVQRCEKQSVDFELKLQHEKEKHKWDSNLKNKNTNPLDYSWISKMEKLEDENVSLDFTVQSLIKERDNVKLEYQKLFNSIKKTRSQTQTEMDELIAHISEKTYAYGAICAENQNLLFTILELKTRLANVEKGDNLLTGGRESNLYTISISDMAASSPVCLMSKATLAKSSLWHRRLSHLNFSTINDLSRLDLVDGLLKFKYGKDLLCSACERGKSKKVSHPLKLVPNETLEIIKKFIAQAQLNYKAKVCKIRTDNGTEFKNGTLKAHYEKLPEFLWAEVVATACFTQNRSIIHTRHNKAPYESLHGRKPNVEYFHMFGSLCYPTNDQDDLGKMKPKADIGVFIGYLETSRGFRIYNRRTKKIMETIHVKFDELTAMASEHVCLEPELQRFINHNSSAEIMNTPSKEDLDNLFCPMYEEYFEKKFYDTPINSAAQPTQIHEDSPSTSSIIIDEHEAPPIV
ncbi:integrase, catalytic region, zinc finger, CCHC-type containing protein, partial [Tanacetum coccineum]